jgi:hypothetical protein
MLDLLTQNFDLADDVSGRHDEPLVEDASGPVELTRDLDESQPRPFALRNVAVDDSVSVFSRLRSFFREENLY